MLARPRFSRLLLALIACPVLLMEGANARADILAGPIVDPANGHTYYLLTTNTWTASEAEALTLGGHLATINDLAENQWGFNTFTPLTGATRPALWIGLNDAAVEGTFVWASGEPDQFTHWASGEPINGGGVEDWVHLIDPLGGADRASRWNDAENVTPQGPVMFFGVVEVVPEPASALLILSGFVCLFLATGGRVRTTQFLRAREDRAGP
jgi:hypothetical protein